MQKIAVFVILAALMPIAHVVSTDMYAFVTVQMEESFYANILYENNPLLMFIDGILPSDLDPSKWVSKSLESGFQGKDWGNLL